MRNSRIVIGTRGSRLARAQADIVVSRIRERVPGCEPDIEIIVTSGDRDQKSHLTDIGGKGIFIRELEQALLDGRIDVAVHSFKDVTSRLAPSLTLGGFLAPESVCDVMVTHGNVPFDELPRGARVGTGSMRRKALLKRLRPDLSIEPVRGNVDTRLAKVERREYDAVMLSEAGLIRLGLEDSVAVRFDPSIFYPAPGQGVITLEMRENEGAIGELCALAGDEDQMTMSTAELALLNTIGFDCRTPLGIHTTSDGTMLHMSGFYIDGDTGAFREERAAIPRDRPAELGRTMARLLLKGGGS